MAKLRTRTIEHPDQAYGVLLAVVRAAWVTLAVMVALTVR